MLAFLDALRWMYCFMFHTCGSCKYYSEHTLFTNAKTGEPGDFTGTCSEDRQMIRLYLKRSDSACGMYERSCLADFDKLTKKSIIERIRSYLDI